MGFEDGGNSSDLQNRSSEISEAQAPGDSCDQHSRTGILEMEQESNSSNQQGRTENSPPHIIVPVQEGEDKTGEGTSTVKTIVSNILSRLDSLRRAKSTSPIVGSIYRIPRRLFEVNEKAFTPLVVSIGPFHYHSWESRAVDDLKFISLESFLSESKGNGTLESYVKLVEANEQHIRRCYANPIDEVVSEWFIQRVLLDSVFIIQLLRFYMCETGVPIPGFYSMINQIERDLMLAENQLPFFILSALYKAAFIPDGNTNGPSFEDLVYMFLVESRYSIWMYRSEVGRCSDFLGILRRYYLPSDVKRRNDSNASKEEERKKRKTFRKFGHLCMSLISFFYIRCKLFRWFPRRLAREEEEEILINIMSPSATGLHQAGVKFVAVFSNHDCLLDIRFNKKKGILSIPKLRLDNTMEDLLMNLIAYEQCGDVSNNGYYTSYGLFMDFLINTPEDVKLLVEAGIIENLLGSDDHVCRLFNTFAKDIELKPESYYYKDISQKLKRHCKRPINRHGAILKQKYFGHPWAGLSVIYAIVLLLLTIGQFVTGIISLLQK